MKQQAYNPFLPAGVCIPDGEPHVFGDRVYLFGSHDQEGGDSFCLLDYEVWSAPVNDLSDWSCRGVSYSSRQDPRCSETMSYMYAPDCVRGNDGRYYLYYCLAGWRGVGGYSNPISVAVCDTPDGNYHFYGTVRNPDGTPFTRYICFDPAVINDNGTIRLYFGTNYSWFENMPLNVMKERAIRKMSGRTKEEIRAVPEGIMGAYHAVLLDDMVTLKSLPRRIDTCIAGKDYPAHSFFEGASIRKIGDRYCFIWSSIKNDELCYALSNYPDGNFVYGGTIVSAGDTGLNGRKAKDRLNHTGTTHGSIECINGTWYVFYHRLTHGSDYSRQACAEKITILADGSIPQVEVTSCGLNGRPLQAEGTYPAWIACNITNGRMPHTSNGKVKKPMPKVTHNGEERYITDIRNRTLIGFKYFVFEKECTLRLVYRSEEDGEMEICVREDGPAAAILPIEKGTSWHSSETVLQGIRGTHPLYFRYQGNGSVDLLEFTLTLESN